MPTPTNIHTSSHPPYQSLSRIPDWILSRLLRQNSRRTRQQLNNLNNYKRRCTKIHSHVNSCLTRGKLRVREATRGWIRGGGYAEKRQHEIVRRKKNVGSQAGSDAAERKRREGERWREQWIERGQSSVQWICRQNQFSVEAAGQHQHWCSDGGSGMTGVMRVGWRWCSTGDRTEKCKLEDMQC